jgi:hypothetical protein
VKDPTGTTPTTNRAIEPEDKAVGFTAAIG